MFSNDLCLRVVWCLWSKELNKVEKRKESRENTVEKNTSIYNKNESDKKTVAG